MHVALECCLSFAPLKEKVLPAPVLGKDQQATWAESIWSPHKSEGFNTSVFDNAKAKITYISKSERFGWWQGSSKEPLGQILSNQVGCGGLTYLKLPMLSGT